MTDTTVALEASHTDVMAELARYAESNHALAEEVRLLREAIHRGEDDGLAGWADLRPGQEIRVCNDWCRILGTSIEHTLDGEPRQVLLLRPQDGDVARYEVADGERFQMAEPF